jgi:hypothetical protein
VYDYDTQRSLVDRLRDDLLEAKQGAPGEPPTSAQQAALAKAGAFYYFTGTGRSTRYELEKALGAQARQLRFQLLLSRMDAYFLAPRDPVPSAG